MPFTPPVNLEDFGLHSVPFAAIKRPVPMQVEFAIEAQIIETREGPVRCNAGDAIMTGVEGERWPIVREKFLNMYEANSPTISGQSGSYTKRPFPVRCAHVDVPLQVPLSSGMGVLKAEVGDILIQYAEGDFAVISESVFEKTYRQLP
jgi:hypothetical protein